jgi:hypothetical protein
MLRGPNCFKFDPNIKGFKAKVVTLMSRYEDRDGTNIHTEML